MQRVTSCLFLTLLLLIMIIGLSTSADRAAAVVSYDHVWLEKFDSPVLKSEWTILNEKPANWAINTNFLRITTEANLLENSHEHEPNNQFMVNVPGGDFSAMTYVVFDPAANGQFAGMRIRMSTMDYIEIHLTYKSGLKQVGWDNNKGGVLIQTPPVIYDNPDPAVYLRITRAGNIYTGEIRSTVMGAVWTPIGNYTVDYPTALMGLVAGNSQAAESISADFDLMRIEYNGYFYDTFFPVVRR